MVRRNLLTALLSRRVPHKFHYDSIKQTNRWLRLHREYSPYYTSTDMQAAYQMAAEASASALTGNPDVCVISLGCGGGAKDRLVIEALRKGGCEVVYAATDVSVGMVLVAGNAVEALATTRLLVWDMEETEDWAAVFSEWHAPAEPRVICFFGMLPNFEPLILERLAAMARPCDLVLLSANLAPGTDYEEGMRRILPQYNNAGTRDWLMTFLLDLGVEAGQGALHFGTEEKAGLKRVTCHFKFTRKTTIEVEGEQISFEPEERCRLFFSYRYTPALISELARRYGLSVLQQWISANEEEGVFMLRANAMSSKSQ